MSTNSAKIYALNKMFINIALKIILQLFLHIICKINHLYIKYDNENMPFLYINFLML